MNLLRPTPDRLTKHLLPIQTVEAADSSTPLRGVYLERSRKAQNDRAHLTTDLEVTHDVLKIMGGFAEYNSQNIC